MQKIPKPFTFIIRFDVAPWLIADGISMSDASALLMAGSMLIDATDEDLAVSVLSAPSPERILVEQDFTPAHRYFDSNRSEIIKGSPLAYSDENIANTVTSAINLLSDPRDGHIATAIEKLRFVQRILSGDEPISNNAWEQRD